MTYVSTRETELNQGIYVCVYVDRSLLLLLYFIFTWTSVILTTLEYIVIFIRYEVRLICYYWDNSQKVQKSKKQKLTYGPLSVSSRQSTNLTIPFRKYQNLSQDYLLFEDLATYQISSTSKFRFIKVIGFIIIIIISKWLRYWDANSDLCRLQTIIIG